MKRKPSGKSFPKYLQSMCGQPGPDDGIDPRDFFKADSRSRNKHKDWQLCRQVSETLSYVLSGECHDETLRDLIVVEVMPAPDARRLRVIVCPLVIDADFNPIFVLQRLQESMGRLRAEVARSISRRKVPELIFQVVADASAAPRSERGRDEK